MRTNGAIEVAPFAGKRGLSEIQSLVERIEKRMIMRRENERCVGLRDFAEQVDDCVRVIRVELRGRFVR